MKNFSCIIYIYFLEGLGFVKYLIIGNGIAGFEAANTIRENNKECEITIITEQKEFTYFRPRLIEVLAGKAEISGLLVKKAEWYSDKNISVKLEEKANCINASEKLVMTDKGSYAYDKLLLADGSNAFIPPISGNHLKGVFSLKTSEDANAIRKHCEGANRLIVIGSGLLGIESANSMLSLSKEVLVFENGDRILPRQLDKDGSKLLQGLLEEKGIKFVLADPVIEILGDNEVKSIRLTSGKEIDANGVLLSCGVRPNVSLAKTANISIGKGVLVNEYLQTNEQDIYAAGDNIEFNGKLFGLWLPSKEQGKIAAMGMTGKNEKYAPTPPESRLKVAGISLFSAGNFDEQDAESKVIKSENVYKKLVIKDDILIGAIVIGDDSEANKISRVLSGKVDLSTIDLSEYV